MIVVNYGKDPVKTAYDALVSSDIKTYLKNDLSVSLKPNLVTEKLSRGITICTGMATGVEKPLPATPVQRG